MSTFNVGQPPAAAQDILQGAQGEAKDQYANEGEQPKVTCASAQLAQWNNLPSELRERKQWAVAALDKSPLTAAGRSASSTDPTTWGSFEEISRAANERGLRIGYMLHESDPFTCIDLDVKDTTSDHVLSGYHWAIREFDSYTETSTSGSGFHIWVKGNIGSGARREGVEIYSQERFIICTGNVINNKPIEDRPEILAGMLDEVRQLKDAEPLPDDPDGNSYTYALNQLLDDSGNFKDKRIEALYKGEWQGAYPSQSEADFALVAEIAKHTASNAECWKAFQMSVLGKRDKASKPSYMRNTLTKVRTQLAHQISRVEHGAHIADGLFSRSTSRQHSSRHFPLLSDYDLDRLPLPKWIVKRLIPDSGVGLVYGQSGSYKSFLTLDLLAHISNGMEWFGHRVTACPTVYVPFEGRGGIPKRVRAWRLAMSRNRDTQIASNVRFISEPMNLRLQEDRDKLVLTLLENGWAGGVLCIDTLAQAAGDFEENSSKDMGEMLAVFNELQARLGGIVLLVHHSGKDASKGARGHSSLIAAVDFSIACSSDSGKYNGSFVAEKVKDDEAGKKHPFSMLRVHLGHDADGDEITSLTICPTHAVAKEEAISYDANLEAEDDDFILEWVAKEEVLGSYPSKNSLKSQLGEMKEKRKITQARVGGAIERLMADTRLFIAKGKSPSGNVWLTTTEPEDSGSLE